MESQKAVYECPNCAGTGEQCNDCETAANFYPQGMFDAETMAKMQRAREEVAAQLEQRMVENYNAAKAAKATVSLETLDTTFLRMALPPKVVERLRKKNSFPLAREYEYGLYDRSGNKIDHPQIISIGFQWRYDEVAKVTIEFEA